MLCNFIDNSVKRKICTCNYNQHSRVSHPDRVMKEHDLIYIREGTWQISQDQICYDLTAGDVILLQGGHHHYGLTPCTDNVMTCFVHFESHFNDRVSEREKADSSNFWVFPMVVHCKNNKMVEHYFEQIIYSYWSDDAYSKKKTSAYLDLLLCEIASTNELKEQSCSLIEDIKLQIRSTPERFIGLEELSKKYNCSIRTISSKFKKSTGCSLHAWQMNLKCHMADELIKSDPSLTLKEIADTYGFCDEYHLGKCFKKTIGYSPKRLR